MVKLNIAVACITLVIPATELIAQTRPGASDQRAKARELLGEPGAPTKPISRTQEVQPGQPAGADPGEGRVELKNAHLNQDAQPMDPVLVDLLTQWSAASSKFVRLEGEHTRLMYDMANEIERQTEGRFFYERPDKGRIELEPVEITPALLKAREDEVAEATAKKRKCGVKIRKDGKPYELQLDQKELWCCDGQRVYNLDVSPDVNPPVAQVAQLPAEMQGTNIMDSPLPFLFGMPPDKAQRRFRMSFSSPFDPKSGRAYLLIEPRLPQDAREWSKANVILDLKEFLPMAVQILDTAGTKLTVYKFRDIKVNQSTWVKKFLGQNPKLIFTPDLRGFVVHNMDAEGSPQIAGTPEPGQDGGRMALVPPKTDGDANANGPAGVANVESLPYADAVLQLERQGFIRKGTKDPANTIILRQGPAATAKAVPGTVKSQTPEPGTPLKPGMKVELVIWDKSGTTQKQ